MHDRVFDCPAYDLDVHDDDHSRRFKHADLLSVKLPGIRRILPNLVDDHVKHYLKHFMLRCDHVKLLLKLFCAGAIML
jgi:hypothetical protein